jgi:tRNA U34 2-thiouridine synthase MnmA/TrmU
MTETRKAVALISGGLDSMLAARVIMDQGIHVEGINFYTGFCVEGHTHAIRKQDQKKAKRNNALWTAEQLGIKLHIIDIVEEYKDVLTNPRHGYGANLNPCLDCKIFMVGKARQWARDNGFDFIITGEVIGQRPKSQRKETMPVIAEESGADDRLLRPLCAQNLPETLPEREGWVDRSRLHKFSGRSRKPQIALANHYGLEDFAQPAGGCCFLTDPSYASKLGDMWQHQGNKNYELDDIMLLKVGRHIRPNDRFKLIIGREEGENNFLQGYRKQFTHLKVKDYAGPLVLLDGEPDADDIELAARITGRFSQGKSAELLDVCVGVPGSEETTINIQPMQPDELPQNWYL